jgi:hypothetical protein
MGISEHIKNKGITLPHFGFGFSIKEFHLKK